MNCRQFVLALSVVLLVPLPDVRAEDAFSFIVLGDPQPAFHKKDWWEPSPVWIRTIHEINVLSPDFLIVPGDMIVGHHDEADHVERMWDGFDGAARALEVPMKMLPGNHDIWDAQSRAIYVRRYGPAYYSFDHEGCHFVCLDSESGAEETALDRPQLDWLKADLAKHRDAAQTFVFVHRPLWADVRELWDRDVHALLVEHGVDYLFAGHAHQYRYDGVRDGVTYTITGGGGVLTGLSPQGELSGRFPHFMMVTVRGATVHRAVVGIGAVHSPDLITEESFREAEALKNDLLLSPVPDHGEQDKHQFVVTGRVANPFDRPVELIYLWEQSFENRWQVDPAERTIMLNPGEFRQFDFTLRSFGDSLSNLPTYTATATVGALSLVTGPHMPAVVKAATVPRSDATDGGTELVLDRQPAGPGPTDAADLSTHATVRYDDNSVVFYVDVKDQKLVRGVATDSATSDSLSVVIHQPGDGAGRKSMTATCTVFPARDLVQTVPKEIGMTAEITRRDDGYSVVFTIPSQVFGLTRFESGHQFYGEVGVIDVDPDGAPVKLVQWSSRGHFFGSRREFGLLELK